MKQIFVKDLENHLQGKVSEPFFLKKITAVANGKTYYKVFLTDNTGEIECRIWQEFIDEKYLQYQEKVVNVEGMVSSYQGQIQITIEKMTLIKDYQIEDFCPCAENIDSLKKEFLTLVESVQKEHFSKLLKAFFHNKDIFNVFCKRQGGTLIHHAYVGGLLQHTLNVANLCKEIAANRKKFHEGFDMDLLITAALLHDIGKIKEYISFPINKRSVSGKLVGHLTYGIAMVYSVSREENIKFPGEDMDKLLHCLLTHHGTVDGIIPPMLTEAVILSRADETDSRVDAFESAIERDNNNEAFTFYNKAMDLYIYKK